MIYCFFATDRNIPAPGIAKACPVWAEIEVAACPDVFVQMNLAETTHEHECFAAADAQHSFERLPVWVEDNLRECPFRFPAEVGDFQSL